MNKRFRNPEGTIPGGKIPTRFIQAEFEIILPPIDTPIVDGRYCPVAIQKLKDEINERRKSINSDGASPA